MGGWGRPRARQKPAEPGKRPWMRGRRWRYEDQRDVIGSDDVAATVGEDEAFENMN